MVSGNKSSCFPQIKAFRDAHFNRNSDKELLQLAKYLRAIAKLETFESLDHRTWREYMRDQRKKRRMNPSASGEAEEFLDE